ncbi:MAG: EboA domain-containing protein [Rudanella sp.]|nr:EboA domain-containing protein [Rudanella sp.]
MIPATLLTLIENQPDAQRAVVWLREQATAYAQKPTNAQFYRVFTAMPRFTGKAPVVVSEAVKQELEQLRPGFQLIDWTLDRLARVWWLGQYPTTDRAAYVKSIGELFRSAEMHELVALYSALPVLAFPEDWRFQATEGIRSNIADVQTAIMLHNPYPAGQFDEAAWNQMVLKAFFTDKDVSQITGLHARHNPRLTATLRDYAAERRAAGRSVSDHLTALVGH